MCVCNLQTFHRLCFHALQKHSHNQKALKPEYYYAVSQLQSTDLEVQKLHCCSATMQTPRLDVCEKEARKVEGSCCFFQHIRGISESYCIVCC